MATETAACVHYWIIEPSNGPTSPGVCKFCGEIRHFVNSIFGGAFTNKRKREGKHESTKTG